MPLTLRFIVVLVAALTAAALILAINGGLTSAAIAILAGVAACAVIAWAIAAGIRRHRARTITQRQRAEDLCRRYGLTHRAKDEGVLKRRFKRLPEFKSGGAVKHVFEGELEGRAFTAFEHTYVIHTGQTAIPVVKTIFAVSTPNWPRTDITPTKFGGLRRLRMWLGGRVLQLDLPEFNRRFSVRAEDESFAVTLLTPELQQHILDHPGVTWRLREGRAHLIYSGSMKLDKVDNAIERLRAFAALIPEELTYWGES